MTRTVDSIRMGKRNNTVNRSPGKRARLNIFTGQIFSNKKNTVAMPADAATPAMRVGSL